MVDFVRGVLLTLTGVAGARLFSAPLVDAWPASPELTRTLLLLGAVASLGIVLRGVSESRMRAVLFGAGLMVGAALIGAAA